MRVLLDTCVIIDVLQDRKPFSEDSKIIFLENAKQNIKACISAKSITDIYYLTHRQTHSIEQTKIILEKLFSLFEVLDTLASDCFYAMESVIKNYEDSVMVETAAREKVDYIITRNIKDYVNSKVIIISPKEFVEMFF